MIIPLGNWRSFWTIQNLKNELTNYDDKMLSNTKNMKLINIGNNRNIVYSPTYQPEYVKNWRFYLLEGKYIGHIN